ncbi:Mod-A [Triangularia verruculosa]|uniref:Mod-A n=1 Tax=Triangularia verruculosa TaxID=2587418 RepID=A0AAN6XK75_9PEZI|nr:Mod-A [Triangularia verruculosa]
MGNDTNLEEQVAIAALVISLLALLGVVLQYVQAVVGRTNGLPIRDKEVLGKWAEHSKLSFKWFRGEVHYEAPIIFMAASDNTRGPVEGKEIWYVDGTPESCEKTRVELPHNDPASRERVHTHKNELATWILAIEAAQMMERDSKAWELNEWSRFARESGARSPITFPFQGPVTLAVAIQAMTRSFDKHPAVKRPYATTAICHIIELCAVLGIYWKEFDRDNNKYRAEGNGYSVLGNRVHDFGLVFTFEKPGWPRFEKNRVIPTAEVKELSFGNVPTFYRDKKDDRNWKSPINEQKDLKTLQLGSRTEIAETLNLIRCNEYTTQCYSDDTKKHVHLFPVVFEVMAMLARPFHIKDRPFTYLPNPVAFPLNKQAFSPRRLLSEFRKRLNVEINTDQGPKYSPPTELANIDKLASDLHEELPGRDGEYSPKSLNDLHKAIDEVDDSILNKTSKDVVLDVLRRHVQEVLLAINTSQKDIDWPEYSPTAAAPASSGRPLHFAMPSMPGTPAQQPLFPPISTDEGTTGEISFDDLLKTPHEKREAALIKHYFEDIRIRAVSLDETNQHYDQEAAQASKDIHYSEPGYDGLGLVGLQQTTTSQTMGTMTEDGTTETAPGTGTVHSSPKAPTVGMNSRRATGTTPSRAETWRKHGLTRTEVRRNTIWFALVFRMICWLLLHDFDKKDVQLPKSELMGSRLSVFIV